MAGLGFVRVLLTGHDGYIGCILRRLLIEHGHEVNGVDSFLYETSNIGPEPISIPYRRMDIRDITPDDLAGYEAICHLAGVSNDPVGDLDPPVTDDINHQATIHLARQAKDAGIERFIFSSSCSIYGASPGGTVDEEAPIHPVTPYGWSKIHAELGLHELADERFSPVYLRNATAYGFSPRLRHDLVVNNLVGYAVIKGEVKMKSDGTPWRPLIHIEDISRAFLAVLEAPRHVVHDEVFNVAAPGENYQVAEVAEIVQSVVPESRITLAAKAAPDIRDYRVDGSKLASLVPSFQPIWTVAKGVDELYDAFRQHQLDANTFHKRLSRLSMLVTQQEAGLISRQMRRVA